MANLWVAVTDGTANQIAWATDPAGSWTVASTIGFGASPVYAVAFGGGVFVAGGASGKLYYSYDARTWTAVSASNMTGNVFGVGYLNGTWFAGQSGSTNAIRYATDPTGAWGTPTSATFISTGVYGMNSGNGYALAVGNNRLMYATDPAGTWGTASGLTADNYWVAYGDGYFVTVHDWGVSNNVLGYSTAVTTAFTNVTAGFTSTTGSVTRSAKYGDGRWVIGGNGMVRYATAPNGTFTAASAHGFTSFIFALEYKDGVWVGGSGTGAGQHIRTATDPTGTWTAASSVPFGANSVRAIAVGGSNMRPPLVRSQTVTRAAVF